MCVMMPRLPFCFHLRLVLELVVFTFLLTLGILMVFWCFDSVKEAKEEMYYQYVPQCSCWRPFSHPPLNRTKLRSTCNDEAALYEPFQKVVSFSYYQTSNQSSNKVYKDGILTNLKLIQKFYPNYVMRVYTNFSLIRPAGPDQEEFCDLLCTNRELQWCDISSTPSHGNLSTMYPPSTWRYLPLGDPSVELFLSRNLDSVISQREATAVQDWIQENNEAVATSSRKGFQIMRDHSKLHLQPILGGLWAADNVILGRRVTQELQNRLIWYSKAYRPTKLSRRKWLKKYSHSSDVLTELIFKMRKTEIVAYDSYHCTSKLANFTMTRPFPVKRVDTTTDFVGRKEGTPLEPLDPCPMACRPENGKAWEFC